MTDETLFAEALAMAAGEERAAFLEKHAIDSQQKQRVLEFLQASEGTNALDNRVQEFEATQTAGQHPEHLADAGEQVGPYKLMERIGEGGMGEVWVAFQSEPVKRRVAVKLIKAGMDSKAVLARFEAERQALALMDHPNIARVLDAGTTISGRPYFVMELVKGVPITQYCDDKHLPPRQRLELFIPVCNAIQHAHQKGIIHRDIKPSNVLVALYDDHPVPKVIDFGVAKAAGQTLTDKTLMTGFGSVVGTPEYMSPEQASLNNLDIDTRSDVYSLGVLLYELLTGSTPVDRKSLGKAAMLEILRVVREVEAPRPSAKLSTIDTLPSIAANRGTEPKKLSALMKGELDWVLLKALEKDRTRRYDTANGLARDIQRYLADELVEARPPSASYRLKKFVRRHKGQVVAASLLMFVLMAGITGTTYGLFEARHQTLEAERERTEAIQAREDAVKQERIAQKEQQRAEREALAAQAVRMFLSDDLLLQSSTLHQAETRRQGGGNFKVKTNPTIEELLDRAAEKLTPEKIEAKFPGMPLVQAEVLATVGTCYFEIERSKSQEFLERAIELFRTNNALITLPAIKARERLALIIAIGEATDAKMGKGIPLIEGVLEDMKRVAGPYHRNTFMVRFMLARMYAVTNHPNVHSGYHQSLLEDAQREFGPKDLLTVNARFELALSLLIQGRRKEAIQELESLYKLTKELSMQPDDPEYITGLVLLADVYRQENREKEGIEVQEEVLAYWEANGLATDPETWQTRHLQGWDYMRIGDIENALATFRKNIPASIPPYDVMTSEAIYNALMKLGRYEEALVEIQNALELLSHRIGMDERTFEWGRIQARIGHALVKLKRYDEAEGHLVEGYHQMVTFKKDQPSYDANEIPDARMSVYEVHLALKRTDDANRWAEEQIIPELQKEAADRSFLSGRYTPESLKAVAKLAGFYKRTDRVAEALNLIEATLEQGKANGWPLNSQSLFSMLDKSNGWPLAANILQDLETLERIAHHSGRTDLAVSIASDARTQMSKVADAPKYLPARCEYSLGYYLSLHQKPEEAETHLREALRLQMEYDPSLPEASKTRLRLGIVLLDLKNYVEAEPLLIKYYEQTKEQDKDLATGAKSRIPEALDRLIELYTAAGNSDELEKYRFLRADFPSDQTPSPKEQN